MNMRETPEETLWGFINKAVNDHFGSSDRTKRAPKPKTGKVVYESIEDYTAKTGKRFRKTKDQTERNLTRDQAFNETYK